VRAKLGSQGLDHRLSLEHKSSSTGPTCPAEHCRSGIQCLPCWTSSVTGTAGMKPEPLHTTAMVDAEMLPGALQVGLCKASLHTAASAHRITESQNGRGWKGPLWVI